MFTHSMAIGVIEGWLSKQQFEPVLQRAWKGLAQTITPAGEVGGIVGGCGIQASAAVYNHSGCKEPTCSSGEGYFGSSPGLGSVIRAAVSLARYERAFQLRFKTDERQRSDAGHSSKQSQLSR